MAVKIYGVDRLLRELEQRFGQKRINEIVDSALEKGALIFGKIGRAHV